VSFAWFLLALAPVAAFIYVVWAYRKRTAARAASSSKRFAQIFNPSAQPSATTHAATDAAQTESPGTGSSTAAATRGPAAYARRARLLSAQHIQLLDLLDAGLPDHEVFAHVSLAAVIEFTGLPEGREREQRLRALAQQTVDCVVCSNAFEVVAVVDLESGHTAEMRYKAECLKAAGVRYLRWNPLELPRSHEVAALIAGD
jgi:hypothetical protein